MPSVLTDVHNIVFSTSSIGTRGYHKDEVDAFRQRVEAEVARLTEENNNLRDRVEPLPPRPVTAPTPPPIRAQALPDGEQSIHTVKVLGLAQEMAERLTSEARAGSDATLRQARTTFEQLLCEAGSKADRIVNEARSRAETTLNDARVAAETVDRQSRNAASLVQETARRHNENIQIIAALIEETSTLEQAIEDLRTFEFEYRIHLKAYLESQLGELDERGSGTSADAVDVQPDLVAAESGVPAAER